MDCPRRPQGLSLQCPATAPTEGVCRPGPLRRVRLRACHCRSSLATVAVAGLWPPAIKREKTIRQDPFDSKGHTHTHTHTRTHARTHTHTRAYGGAGAGTLNGRSWSHLWVCEPCKHRELEARAIKHTVSFSTFHYQVLMLEEAI